MKSHAIKSHSRNTKKKIKHKHPKRNTTTKKNSTTNKNSTTKKYKKRLSHKKKTHKAVSKYTLNDIKLYKNASGTRILVMPNRNETETATIYFYFKVGSKNETEKIHGITHFIEHMLFKGSKKYPNYLDISKTLDANGISFNAYTAKDSTAYHFKYLSKQQNHDLVCRLASDFIMNPLMREKDIATERNVIIQEYNDDLDDIDEYIADKIEESLFKGHPLGLTIIGTLETLNKIDRKDIIEYYKTYYRPDNLLIGISGCINDETLHTIQQYFGGSASFKPQDIKSQGVSHIIPFVEKQVVHPKINCFQKSLTQDYIHIIFKTGGYFDPNLNNYKMLANILGSNMSSHLFVEIREKLGLVYSIKTDLTNYEEVGYFDIYTQNEAKDTKKCIEKVLEELIKIKKHGVSEKELAENKKNYTDVFKTYFDDIQYENEYFSKQVLYNRPLETVEMRITNIEKVSVDDIKNAACQLFDFSKMHIVTFGEVNKKTIEKIVKKFI